MGVFLVNKTQNPIGLPYPYRGVIAGGGKIAVNLTELEAYTALALVLGQKQNSITVEANAPPPFNDLVTGDAASGLLIGAISSPIALSNVVIVQQFSDFPSPVGSTVTLAADTVYKVNGPIDCGNNKFVLSSGTVLEGFTGAARDSLTTTNASAFLTNATGSSFEIKDITLSSVNGFIFNVSSAPTVLLLSSLICTSNKIGMLSGTAILMVDCFFDNFNEGITFSTGGVSLSITNCHFGQIASPTPNEPCIDLGSRVWTNFIRIANCDFKTGTNGFAISGLAGNGNLVPGAGELGLGEVTGCVFSGTGTALQDITINDLRWAFTNLLGQQNSLVMGALEITTPVSTPITVQNVFVKANGTTTIVLSARFNPTPASSNRMEFLGITTLPLRIDISGTLSKDGAGGSVLYEIAIFKNGVQLGTATANVDADNRGDPYALTQIDLSSSATDFYEVHVANVENPSDGFILNELSMLVSAIPTGF